MSCYYLFLSFFVIRLEEAEEKYRSRQSRPEDLEIIDQLKRALAERELDMKKLVVSAAWFIICKNYLSFWSKSNPRIKLIMNLNNDSQGFLTTKQE